MNNLIEKFKEHDPKQMMFIGIIIFIVSTLLFFVSNNISKDTGDSYDTPKVNQETTNTQKPNIKYEELQKKFKDIEDIEKKQLEDFLNNRANRIATKDFLENVLKEKSSTAEQMKEKFPKEYSLDSIKINESIDFTKKALEAFNGKNTITDIKFLLLNKIDI